MKKLFLIFIFLLISQPCLSKTLQGGVVYTVETARIEAFKDVPLQRDMSEFNEFLFDKNYQQNLKTFKSGKKKFRDRYITTFSDNTYSIEYKNDKRHCYYYDALGQLTHVEFLPYDQKLPCKSAAYDINGKLDSTRLDIGNNEQFVFEIEENRTSHWIDKNCYNENGELIFTRSLKY